jgi:hypothetical protein
MIDGGDADSGDESRPQQPEPELRPRLGTGGNPRRAVVGGFL